MFLSSVQLTLRLGPTIPVPAPVSLVEALQSVEVQQPHHGRAGFSLTFQSGRAGLAALFDAPVVSHPLLQPDARVQVIVTLGARPRLVLDGVVTRHDHAPSNRPGASTFRVTGEDLGVLMDRDEALRTHRGIPAAAVITEALGDYVSEGIVPDFRGESLPAPTTPDAVITQRGTDYQFLLALAQRYDQVFRVAPDPDGAITSVAYWGPAQRSGVAQRALSIDLGPATNVEGVQFGYDPRAQEQADGALIDDDGRVVTFSDDPPSDVPLSRDGAAALAGSGQRRVRLAVAGSDLSDARARATARRSATRDALTVDGELDVLSYGDVLQAGATVDVRGAGQRHDGRYYVRQVTHQLQRGRYRQRFSLAREGRGTTTPAVRP